MSTVKVPADVRPEEDRGPDRPARWATLFNQDRFHALNLRDRQRVVTAGVRDADGRLIGALSGVLEDGVFVSGHSAPFGGLDLVRERETPANVARLVDGALEALRAQGARTVRLRLPPPCYGDNEGLVQFTLLNRGFAVERCELNQHIDLHGLAGPRDYVAGLKSPARRALRQLLGPEFTFRPAQSAAEWDRAHALLSANRARKGRTLALSRAYVEGARAALGDRVRMVELLHADRAVAAALVYRVREQRDLVVAWGDADHHLERSPMNLLAYRVVEAALADGVRIVDLGISSERESGPDGALLPNAGLVQFKQSVLARTQPRLTLIRSLPEA
ncbi:MAG: hypothetical protein JWO02_1234 [Solirubrobacterales bacterium]|nr:hypothetical protein [Solirubrobacterales bacterium]